MEGSGLEDEFPFGMASWQMRTVSFREGMVWWNSTMSQLMMNPSFCSKAFRIRKSQMAFLGDDFKCFLACSPLFGDMIQFDQYFTHGLKCWKHQLVFENGFRTQFVSKTFLWFAYRRLLLLRFLPHGGTCSPQWEHGLKPSVFRWRNVPNQQWSGQPSIWANHSNLIRGQREMGLSKGIPSNAITWGWGVIAVCSDVFDQSIDQSMITQSKTINPSTNPSINPINPSIIQSLVTLYVLHAFAT